jgi:hypothetical protein
MMPHAPTTPNASDITVDSSITQEDNPKDHFTLSQLEIQPTKTLTANSIQSSAGLITSFLKEEHNAQIDDLALQTRQTAEGRTYGYNTAIQQKCIIIKLAIPSDTNSDQLLPQVPSNKSLTASSHISLSLSQSTSLSYSTLAH